MASLLNARTAVITGGAQGLGLAIGQRFVAEGARVVLGDVNLEATEVAAKRLGGDDVALAVRCDVTQADDVDILIRPLSSVSAVWMSWSTTPGSPATQRCAR